MLEFSRRVVLGGGVLVLVGGDALAQATSGHSAKMQAWVDDVLLKSNVSPMSHGRVLGFRDDEVQRKQVGVTTDGVSRLFAVVVPQQSDGIILAMGRKDSKTYNVHRTGVHLRRIASGRNIGGNVSVWSGAECDSDFEAQIAYWTSRDVS